VVGNSQSTLHIWNICENWYFLDKKLEAIGQMDADFPLGAEDSQPGKFKDVI